MSTESTERSTEPVALAADFETPTREQWEAEVLKVLNRKRPPGTELTIDKAMERLRTRTVDGLVIEPLYMPEDAADPLGEPAATPFLRGATRRNGDPIAWDIRQFHEDPNPDNTHKFALQDLERGATSLWLRIDPDGIKAEDLKQDLGDVLFDLAPIAVSSHTDQAAAADALLEIWNGAGKDKAQIRGNLGIDPLAHAARTGDAAEMEQLAAFVAKVSEFPEVSALTVDVLPYHEAGASDVDEVAFAIATGIEYLRALADAGVSAEDAAKQLLFRLSATAEQFTTIAKLRALRGVWARVAEECGIPESGRGAIEHVVTSKRMMTRDDPWVNLLRGTIACFAASVGGAEIITVHPFDTIVGLPDEFSRRIARNTQVILSEESNIGRVNDPAGGSWYVESLTRQIAKAAWKRVQEIEAAGGMKAYLEAGKVSEAIEQTVAERDKRIATRKQPITGVSMFPMRDEAPLERPARPERHEAGLGMHRDAEQFEALRDRSAKSDPRPAAFLAALGTRRDFGPRLTFTENIWHVAGVAIPTYEGLDMAALKDAFQESGAKVAVICSATKVYAEHGLEAAKALREAGAQKVFIAGKLKELGDADTTGVIDGEIFDGMDVTAFLSAALDEMGAAK